MPTLDSYKKDICHAAHCLHARGFTSANDGNISIRVDEDAVLCTPTLQSKGTLKPEDLVLVNMAGEHIEGTKRCSSEIFMHLEILKAREDVRSCVHCHPPHATAFAIAGEPIPQSVMPEVEDMLGEIPIAAYETPGGKACAESVLPFVHRASVILLANHGAIGYAENVERALWYNEIVEAYCRILILARSLGNVNHITEAKTQELLDIKGARGAADPRNLEEFANCKLRNHVVFRDTWPAARIEPRAFAPATDGRTAIPPTECRLAPEDREELISEITARVVAALSEKE